MALSFIEYKKHNGDCSPLPEIFKLKKFRSFADMSTFADEHNLPDGTYFIRNDKGGNLLTRLRELRRKGSSFWVEGRGYV